MSDEETKEVEYVKDEGYVRLSIRKPVNFYVPTELLDSYDPEEKKAEPSASLDLECVYGYRGKDCCSNVFVLASGEIVYFTAAVAVVYNVEESTQRFYTQHVDDIKCMDVHPNKVTVATGQTKGRGDEFSVAHVRVWCSETLETLHVIGEGILERGVSCLAFSRQDGELLAIVDDSPEPKLSVWKWHLDEMVAEQKASAEIILDVLFTEESPARIVTFGKGQIGFFSLSDNGSLTKKTGIFGSHERPKYVICATCLPSGELVTGDSNGNLFVWERGSNLVSSVSTGAHDGSVFCITVTEDGWVLTGGKDSKVVKRTLGLEDSGEYIELGDYGQPRALAVKGSRLIIGTKENGVVSADFVGNISSLTHGHVGELWGLATHPAEQKFITAGQDGRVFYRNAESFELIWMKTFEEGFRSTCISVDGTVAVLGGLKGKWIVISLEDQEILYEGEDGDEPIQVMSFSPDGTYLALGSRDNKVYVYTPGEEFKEFSAHGVCEGHSSFITYLDWSEDSTMIRTNSGDYETLHWVVSDCSLESKADSYRDVTWSTSNCILSFDTLGIWPPGIDGTDINGANKGHGKPLLASGDDSGLVKLFDFPVQTAHAPYRVYRGHSSHVTTVCFLHDDSRLISAGGWDTSVMQWKVTSSDAEE